MELPAHHALQAIKQLMAKEVRINITEWFAGKTIEKMRGLMEGQMGVSFQPLLELRFRIRNLL